MDRPWIKHYDAGVPATLDYPPKRVFDFLDESAFRWPENIALIYRGRGIRYRDLARLADRLASALTRSGLEKGQRVGLILPNCPQFVAVYFAILKAGGVVCAINPHYTLPEMRYQLKDSDCEIVIAHVEAKRAVEGFLPRLTVWTAEEDAFEMQGWLLHKTTARIPAGTAEISLEQLLLSGEEHDRRLADVIADDVAIFQYSGGTTGTPKAAIGLHRNLAANTLQFRWWLHDFQDGQETALLAIPLYHVYGMVVGLCVATKMGARMVLAPNPRDINSLFEWIHDYRVGFFPGVPTLYALMNRHPDAGSGRYDLSSIRACISGSAPLSADVREQFERLTGARLMEGYGLSEAPTATHCNPMMGERRNGSIGLPLPDVECRILGLEEPREDVAPGESGELLIRGPQVMQGYHNRPEESAEILRGGWLHTGDVARMDQDGYFYILDRIKDLIKVSGFQVWPREVEEVLGAHPAVQECGVVGVPDPMRGEAVKAWVVLRKGMYADMAELADWCRKSLVYYKVPSIIAFCDALPRSGVGKLLRKDLRGK